jgi:hypothetical protein
VLLKNGQQDLVQIVGETRGILATLHRGPNQVHNSYGTGLSPFAQATVDLGAIGQ